MTFSASILSVLVAGAVASSSRPISSKEFTNVMQEPAIRAARKKAQANKVRELNESLIKASRKLQNNQYYNYNADYNQDGVADGYYMDGVYYAYEEAPFDMTSRAFKYSGCAAIKSYDTDRAQENGNPMVMDTYAVFRLCPADKCNQYSVTGCTKNYGEYAVEMKTYLSYVLGYYDDRYEEYCEYCEGCDWEYQALSKYNISQCYSQLTKWQNYQGYNQNTNAYNMQNQANQNAASANQAANYNKYYYGNNANNGNADNAEANNADANDGGRRAEDADNAQEADAQEADAQEADNAQDESNGQSNQQASAYGYYDANGDWIDGDSGAGNQFGYWGADGIFYPYDQEIDFSEVHICRDGFECDYCEWQNEELFKACDTYVCGDYYTYCSDLYKTEQQVEFDPLDYLECTAWDNGNGQIYYLAPHCGSDHYTISLGVFSDENCIEWMGEDVSISAVLGFQFADEDIMKIPKECISCDGAEDYAEQQGASGQGVYGEYVSAPETTKDGIVAMCSALYSGSAQCNMNMNNFATISRYMSQYELDLEARYCAFIENIVYGAYDESGEILLHPESFDFNDWRNPKQYKKLRMAPIQAIGLSLSIILCVALFAAAAVTNRSLTRSSSPWKPQRSDVSVSRQNSGIVLGRSRSGPGTAPLI